MRNMACLALSALAASVLLATAAQARPDAPAAITYLAVRGDTLSAIAQTWTGKAGNWVRLGRLNRISNERTIPIGSPILIPLDLLPDEPAQARVAAFSGAVTVATAAGAPIVVAVGATVSEGAQIRTGPEGFISLELPDASRIALPSDSAVTLSRLRTVKHTGTPRIEITLQQGRVESRVTPLPNSRGRFEIRSKWAVAGVRGTHFRVGAMDAGITHEVLSGRVAVGRNAQLAALTLDAGQGNVVDKGKVGPSVTLLPAPALLAECAPQQRPTLKFNLQAVSDAVAYRAQIAADPDGNSMLAEKRSENTELKIDGMADGSYFVRLTAIDRNGLEGPAGVYPFTLKARPEPPLIQTPQSKLRAEHVDFSWTEAPQAQSYHLQIAPDTGFSKLLIDANGIAALHFTTDQLAPGTYFWRLASVALTGGKEDHGPFSDPMHFTLLPPQKMPVPADTAGDNLSFRWPAEAGQTFTVEIARDAAFSSLLLSRQVDQAEIRLPRPDPGIYYIRVQATDPDGYIGAFSNPQKFQVASRWLTGSGAPLENSGGMTGTGY